MNRLFQFTRDFFEPERPLSGAAGGSNPAAASTAVTREIQASAEQFDSLSNLKEKQPSAQAGCAQATIKNIAKNHPSQTSSQAPLQAAAAFHHPRATRQALLGDIVVAYEFKRSKRRTIGFSVGAEGLAVSGPNRLPLYEIDKAVLEKSGWILKKLQESRERCARLESARIEWKDGATIFFMGEPVKLLLVAPLQPLKTLKTRMAPVAVYASTDRLGNALPEHAKMTLHVELPASASPDQIRDAVKIWLMRQAKAVFIARLNEFAPPIGVQWRKLTLSSASTRWGSASTSGSIRLNWRLIHFSQAIIDYVVVHELSHLQVMDHSPRFWATVRAVLPNYAQLRSQLKTDPIPRW